MTTLVVLWVVYMLGVVLYMAIFAYAAKHDTMANIVASVNPRGYAAIGAVITVVWPVALPFSVVQFVKERNR